jgi:arginine exporter protein ArgO
MGWPGLCSFYLGHISADLVWYCIVAFAVASGRRLCPPKIYRALIVSCGVILIGIGVFFFVKGVGYWL